MHGNITDVPGIQVGHWTDEAGGTGCTVVLCPQGATAGVDVRGGAPATRETDLLAPSCTVQQAHAIVLAGGSAFGLAAADGVMGWLEQRGYGFDTGVAKVPIAPAACLFDLAVGRADARPDAAAGYAACEVAVSGPLPEGNVGAGTGATVGKLLGFSQATKAGVGNASTGMGDVVVAALAAVNAVGEVIDPEDGSILAGVRDPAGDGFLDAMSLLRHMGRGSFQNVASGRINTTLVVVAANAQLDKAQAQRVAMMAHDGIARVIRPAHHPFDGDIVFTLATGEIQADVGTLGALAAEVVASAIVRGVRAADSLHGVLSAKAVR